MAKLMKLNLKAENDDVAATSNYSIKRVVELGNSSQVIYMPKLLNYHQSWDYLDYLNKNIPWNRPTIRVFGRSCLQPRDTCYVASEGLPQLVYSGYQPHTYSWDEFPPLKDMLDAVHKALPGSRFNSLLLNRYKGGDDYVGWHADDEKLYGPTPEIASLSFGCEREFLLKKKPDKTPRAMLRGLSKIIAAPVSDPLRMNYFWRIQHASDDILGVSKQHSHFTYCKNTSGEPPKKRSKKDGSPDKQSFVLKHGSLLVMRGYTQRDWLHSVPKRVKADSLRINLTFRLVL